MRVPAADELVDAPTAGPVHEGVRRAYAGDVGTDGRLRLDGVLRLLQDVAGDDLEGSDDLGPGWVVRRSLVVVDRAPRLRESLELRTWCSGLGSRWAERRTSMLGDRGGRVEAASLWVHIDVASGRPRTVPDAYRHRVAPEARVREVTARLRHDLDVPASAVAVPWQVRIADLDVLDHVNNAVAGAAAEEAVAQLLPQARGIARAEIEYRAAIDAGAPVDVRASLGPDGTVAVWVLRGGTSVVGSVPAEAVHVTARLAPRR